MVDGQHEMNLMTLFGGSFFHNALSWHFFLSYSTSPLWIYYDLWFYDFRGFRGIPNVCHSAHVSYSLRGFLFLGIWVFCFVFCLSFLTLLSVCSGLFRLVCFYFITF